MKSLDPSLVSAIRLAHPDYPERPPFHPGVRYPEYKGELGQEENHVYESVRESLHLLGMDAVHYGSPEWNPLGEIVRPGNRVVLKPNLISQGHALRPDEWMQVITHGSVVRAVIDYVLLALKGEGVISIIDGPQYDSDWDEIMTRTGLDEVARHCSRVSGVEIKLIDLRDYRQEVRDEVICNRVTLPSDPLGGVEINLGGDSALANHGGSGRYFGSDYDQGETNRHHSGGRHEYRISRTAASADVFINIPKLKTHKKVGVTLCMKNLVGINMGRNWLPHHTDGDPSNGGDQFPSPTAKSHIERSVVRWLQRQSLRVPGVTWLYRFAKVGGKRVFGQTNEVIRHGNWHGNDTCWRMVHDINRCFLNGDGKSFPIVPSPKRYFAVVDGVVGGQGNGPTCPETYPSGVIMAGFNPVAVDCSAARLMGFNPHRLPQFARAFDAHRLPLADFPYDAIRLVSNEPAWNNSLEAIPTETTFHFKPHFGWTGHIEQASRESDCSETSHRPLSLSER
jgi:uncharacterized protein (DUF362 family)